MLLEKYPLHHFAKRTPNLTLAGIQHRFRRLLKSFVRRTRRIRLPEEPLVLLLDGLWFRFGFTPWVLYQMALKPASANKATFLDPVLLQGKESAAHWDRALAAIPKRFQRRIVAVVVDNLRGMEHSAKRRGWILQLCQFHMLLKFQVRRRMLVHSFQGGPARSELYRLIRRALKPPGGAPLRRVIRRLRVAAENPSFPNRVQGAAREFVEQLAHYRACIDHPEMRLPSTTNAVESMGSLLRDVFKRHHSAVSPKSVLLWATVVTRLRSEIVCNGKSSTD